MSPEDNHSSKDLQYKRASKDLHGNFSRLHTEEFPHVKHLLDNIFLQFQNAFGKDFSSLEDLHEGFISLMRQRWETFEGF